MPAAAVDFWARTKPPVGAQLDLSLDLARAINGYWLFAEAAGIPRDLVKGTRVVKTGTPAWRGTPMGTAYDLSAASTSAQLATTSRLAGNASFTILVWGATKAVTTVNGCPIYSERGATGNAILKLDALATNGGAPSNKLLMAYRDDAGTLTQSSSAATSSLTSINDGVIRQLGLVKRGTVFELWVNGVLEGSITRATGTDTLTATSLQTVLGGDPASATSLWAGWVNQCVTWTRALAPAEIQHLNEQPFALFEPPLWRRYYILQPFPPGLGAGLGLLEPSHYDRPRARALLVQHNIQRPPLALLLQPTPGQSSIPSRTFPRPPRWPEGLAAPASLGLTAAAPPPVPIHPGSPDAPLRAVARLVADFQQATIATTTAISPAPITPSVAGLPVRRSRQVPLDFQGKAPPDNPAPAGQTVIPSRSLLNVLRPAPASWALQLVSTLTVQPAPFILTSAEPPPAGRAYPAALRSLVPVLQLTLLAPSLPDARGQAEPIPFGRPLLRVNGFALASQQGLLSVVALPDGRGTAEPAPPARRPERQHAALPLNLNLLAQDTFYGGPGQQPWRIVTELAPRARPQPTSPSLALTVANMIIAATAQPPFTPAVTSRQPDPWLGRYPPLSFSLGFSAQQILDQTRPPFTPPVTERRGDPWLGRQVLLGYTLLVQPQAPQQQFYAPGQVAPWGNFPLPPRPYPRGVSLLGLDFETVRLYLIELVEITYGVEGPAAAALVYEAFSDALAHPYEVFSGLIGALYQAAADALGLRYEARADGLPDIDYEADSDPLR